MEATAPVRVMLVEDDAPTRTRFVDALSRDPRVAMVGAASTARDAIARLAAAAPPHVLLVDLGLPDKHGTEVIRAARRACPDCEVMVITMFGDEGNVIASIEAGATGYVLKDASASALVDAIMQLRAGGAPMSPGVARLVLNRMRASAPRRHADAGDDAVTLTAREAEVLSALSRGYTYAEVAHRLGISVHTLTSHIKNSYRKLSVHSAAAAVTRAAELGLLNNGPMRKE